ncbi:MAG: LUD domain-containing protein [Bacteroidales bacterium]|jgi:L-lactate dehydrogenase complex protein LldF|nr:LUD domain-containing protein [Bacteroidales bacterium]
MSTTLDTYLESAKKGINNKNHRTYAEGIFEHYQTVLENADSYFKHPNLLKKRASFSKYKAINALEKYLVEFECLFIRRGGRIIWAADHEEATKEIIKLLRDKGIKKTIKSNSKVANEIQLNKAFEDVNIDCLETEFNAFYNQLQKNKPESISFPILNTDFAHISQNIQKSLNVNERNIQQTLDYVKKYLINQCTQIRACITGVNFLVSDIGGLVICENQGNIAMTTSFPEIHIALCGVEKMIPSLVDLEKFLHLLATHTSNDMLPWNTQIITGPRQEGETDGPKELYLVLIDNKRTEVMKHVQQREIFNCIHCGACASVCPVYKLVGGEPYGDVYVGPVGSVVNPFMMDFYYAAHQSYACTLCKRCTEVCPMNIPIHELILQNRREAVRREFYVTLDRSKIKQLRKMMIKRAAMDSWLPNYMLKMSYKKLFGSQKIFPDLSQRSFNVRYREKHDIK